MPPKGTCIDGRALKKLRALRDWTQQEAAHMAGIGHRTWSRAERTGKISPEKLAKIEELFGVQRHQLAASAGPAGGGGAGSVQAKAYPSKSDMTAQAAAGGVREPTATFTTEDPAAGGDAMRFGPDAEVAMIQRIHDLERLCGSQALELQQLRHALERERRRGYNQPDDRPDEKGGRR